jgi:hypothetical protein
MSAREGPPERERLGNSPAAEPHLKQHLPASESYRATLQSDQFHPGAFRRGLRYAGLTHGEFRVAVEMSEHANVGNPVVWPGAATLAEICGMTKYGVRLVLKQLAVKRVIVRADLSANKGGRGHANRWRLLVIPESERGNDGCPFNPSERGNDGLPFNPERGNYETPKGATTDTERGNGRCPEVVRSSEREVGGSAGAWATSERIPIEPPSKTCTQHQHWDGPACARCGSDKRAYQTWLADNRRLLADLDRLYDSPNTQPAQAAAISAERRGRIAVFQRIGEPWKNV